MSDNQLGDKPIEEKYTETMRAIAAAVDSIFNGELCERTTGFVLMVFPFNGHEGRCNYISNAQREDVKKLLKEQLARFENREEQEKSEPS